MLKTRIRDDIDFAYHDSGPPPNESVYDTIILLHGHTYHSGTFRAMLDYAHTSGVRIILPNRRLYPGSTPYTKEEVEALQPDKSVEDRTMAFMKQGEYLLVFLYNVITEHNLGNIIVGGCSLGTAFLAAMIASITTVGEDVQSKLRKSVKSIVLWDPPSQVHGIQDPPTGGWIPLYDESIPHEVRGQVFSQWVSQYFPHKFLDKKDCNNLVYKIDPPVKPATFSGMPFEELLTKVDLTAGENGDTVVADLHFRSVLNIVTQLALFDGTVRSAWGNVPFAIVYGEESPYCVIWAVWKFEEEAERTGLPLKFISIPGGNHFAMHDLPELSLRAFKACC